MEKNDKTYKEYGAHNYNIQYWQNKDHKAKKPDIEFATDAGSCVKLVWEKPEYRAYINGERSRYGATVPEGLIEFIKKNF